MQKRHVLTAALFAAGGIGLISLPVWAQDQSNQPNSPAASGQSASGQAANPSDAASGAQTAGARSDSSAASAQQASQSDARQALAQSTNAAISKGGLQNLSKQFSQADQHRLGDLSQKGQQLDQSIDQLRQAYKDKYQKDLDLSSEPEVIFTAQFFQIGGADDQARQASARQAPDSAAAGANANSNAANTPAADQAQTAGASMARRAVIIIPASHGQQEARVGLIQEGGQWKIDVPDSIDAQQLSQNLQTQLQQAVQEKDQWPADANQAQQAIAHRVLIVLAQPASASDRSGAGTSSGAAPGSSDTTGTTR